ncbi:CDPK-related kinase 5, partial [Bienertia sinuspersici]
MTTAIAIEDVRREVKILKGLAGHCNLIKIYDAYEDNDNCGKYTEDDAKVVLVQIFNVVSFCHLQGVVHRDLKPENFLFTSKDEDSSLKAIDFGLSDFVKPDEKLNDIVGSAYYVAPEVLDRSYTTEADVWSVGSGIFRAILKVDPSFTEPLWPSLSSEARDFVNRMLNKDPRKRITAAQALSHPWLRNHGEVTIPLDILFFKLLKIYLRSSSLRKAALRALSKTLTVDELFYLKEQFALLQPCKIGIISLENIKEALLKNATDAMKESRAHEILTSVSALWIWWISSSLSAHNLIQLLWDQHARCAYELFEKDGKRPIMIEELAS